MKSVGVVLLLSGLMWSGTADAACSDVVGAEAELVRCNALLARSECSRAEAHCRVAVAACADDGRFANALNNVLKSCSATLPAPTAGLDANCADAACGPGLRCSRARRCEAAPLSRVHALERLLAGRKLRRHSPCDARHQVEAACTLASNADHDDLVAEIGPELTALRPACVAYDGPICGASLDDAPMVQIPAGSFQRGSNDAALDRGLQLCRDTYSNGDQCTRDWFVREAPSRKITLSAYAIDKHEVTNAQYGQCVEAGVCPPIDYGNCKLWQQASGSWATGGAPHADLTKANHPVVCVRYQEAEGYCSWAGKRLPTEAEWERAARGDGDDRDFPWGNTWDPAALNWGELGGFGKVDGYATTAPVGSFPKNESPFGVRDMAGNAWEWVSDYFGDGYYASAPASNPHNARMGANRVLRGGSWSFAGNGARVAYRYFGAPDIRDDAVGFRCAGQSRGGQ
jgi:formylglycine-generating enzyme required for sulfatase activity